MSDTILYPLPFYPIFKDKIWGGQKIHTLLGKDFSPLSNCGEMWLLSDCGSDVSVVSQGPLADNDLNELLGIFFDDLIGDKYFDENYVSFPLLVKIINSSQWLSVQVHPDDNMAKSQGYYNGKSEMWYVLDAEPDAQIVAGFVKKLTLQEYNNHVKNNTLQSVLNFIHVKKGDAVYIPAGLVHALGPGLLVAEIQQSSDLTYRIFDWNRLDSYGKPRELHINLASQAIKFDHNDRPSVIHIDMSVPNQRIELINSNRFNTNIIKITRQLDFTFETDTTFIALLDIEGSGKVSANDVSVPINKGEIVLIPACIENYHIENHGDLQLIEVYV